VKTTVTPVSGPVETSFILGSTEIDDAGAYTNIPHADIRIVGSAACFAHRDHLATVRLETGRLRSVPQSVTYTRDDVLEIHATGWLC
jgi:hypothetical protein